MDLALRSDGNMLDRVSLTVTKRDVVLMNLCLQVVAHDRVKGGSLRSDIESLQTRLAQYLSAPSISRKKQAGCGEECWCQPIEHMTSDELIKKKREAEKTEMWRLKGCPKCNGDMLVEQDSHGQYEWCLQCGYHLDVKSVLELSRRVENRRPIEAVLR